MPSLSLTDFVSIVSASGTPKGTKVRQVKNRPPYTPAVDFYKPFRDHVINLHRQDLSRRHIRDILPRLVDAKKAKNYPPLVDGYSRWLGRKRTTWFDPVTANWSAHSVDVRVNPELGLEINGVPHLIKLHLKAESLAKNRTDIILYLMDLTLSASSPQGTVMSVLDVRSRRLIAATIAIPGLAAMLDAELAYIDTLWSAL